MGGKTRNKKKANKTRVKSSEPLSSSFPSSSGPTAATPAHFPLPFPPHAFADLPPSNDGFLRNVGRWRKSYQRALDTAYEGFVCDGPDATTPGGETVFEHDKMRRALKRMDDANYFRTDVTQPFGLGTKCAKTYVTRCLLGERGTTYKYLGLRMFAHPWDGSFVDDDRGPEEDGAAMPLKEALRCFSTLNDTLTRRSELHLSTLDDKRRARGAPAPRGRAAFDVTLINRMEYSRDLKPEPLTGKGRCTVSWHADSCLEHYSTIGVYHTMFRRDENARAESAWSVALRVAHDSEGPQAGRRGADVGVESSSVARAAAAPVISAALPSGAAYYLLDDFNHHHQHAVLAPDTDAAAMDSGVRFSSTHRLLRRGHNVRFVAERCRSTIAGFSRRGKKVWRSEQLLLSDIEFEWIRQFYVQGSGHKKKLWPYWRDEICLLLKYWGQLECRTKQVLDMLMLAAEGRCGVGPTKSTTATLGVPSRAERKIHEKRKKATSAVEEILNRGDSSDNAYDSLYAPMAALLNERAKMRSLWHQREKDKTFARMPREYDPIKPPLEFDLPPTDVEEVDKDEEAGSSPLPGSPDDLRRLASNILQWGKAHQSKNVSDLPESSKFHGTGVVSQQRNDHNKSPSWCGWSENNFGLEMQNPWAGLLLSGEKKVETRAYDLPPSLLGKRILIMESKAGDAGVSSLGDVVSERNGLKNYVNILGWVVFDTVIEYKDKESFERDRKLHLVKDDSGYGWKEGETKTIYGWVVSETSTHSNSAGTKSTPEVGAIIRRMRSLYQIKSRQAKKPEESEIMKSKKKKKKRTGKEITDSPPSSGIKKKKKRY